MELVIPPVQKVSQMLSIRFFISPVIMGGLFSLTYKDTNLEVNHKGGRLFFRGSGGFYSGLEGLEGLEGLDFLEGLAVLAVLEGLEGSSRASGARFSR